MASPAFSSFLVNSVVGFIGPEYLYESGNSFAPAWKIISWASSRVPMGCDVCYTNHAAADQNSADNLLVLLAPHGCNYFMGVPCAGRRDAELSVHQLS